MEVNVISKNLRGGLFNFPILWLPKVYGYKILWDERAFSFVIFFLLGFFIYLYSIKVPILLSDTYKWISFDNFLWKKRCRNYYREWIEEDTAGGGRQDNMFMDLALLCNGLDPIVIYGKKGTYLHHVRSSALEHYRNFTLCTLKVMAQKIMSSHWNCYLKNCTKVISLLKPFVSKQES